MLTRVAGHAERWLRRISMLFATALAPLRSARQGYDAADCRRELRTSTCSRFPVIPAGRRSASDRSHAAPIPATLQPRIRQSDRGAFGWIKVLRLAQSQLRGLPKLDWTFTFA